MGDEVRTRSFSPDNHFTPLFKSQPLGQPEKALGHEPQIDPCVANRQPPRLPASPTAIGVVAIRLRCSCSDGTT
jgi:hypothetical protein